MDGGEGGGITMFEEVEPSMAEVWRLDGLAGGDKVEGSGP